ncbi:hypothetical protein V2J91_23460 [Pseudomonas alliivorans]|nr:hypothetical protein [Pseudomonas alliivorans]
MSFIQFEDKTSMYTYKGVKVRFEYVIAEGNRVVKLNVYAVLDEDEGERRIYEKSGAWPDRSEPENLAREAASKIIDDHLS